MNEDMKEKIAKANKFILDNEENIKIFIADTKAVIQNIKDIADSFKSEANLEFSFTKF